MKKGGGTESTITIGPSKSVLVYALQSLEYVLGLARFRVFVPKLYNYYNLVQTSIRVENKTMTSSELNCRLELLETYF